MQFARIAYHLERMLGTSIIHRADVEAKLRAGKAMEFLTPPYAQQHLMQAFLFSD